MSRHVLSLPLLLLTIGCPGSPRPPVAPASATTPATADAGATETPCAECEDGFGENCFYDVTIYPPGTLHSGIQMPRETEAACFALESYSHCGTCYHTCRVRREGELLQASCEEMERAIEEKNRACGDCLKVIQSGCC